MQKKKKKKSYHTPQEVRKKAQMAKQKKRFPQPIKSCKSSLSARCPQNGAHKTNKIDVKQVQDSLKNINHKIPIDGVLKSY